jgi:low temperature requirement protein LtrA
MTTDSAGRQWTATEAQGATFVELFFDLVFVFAVTSVTSLLLHDLTWTGVGHAVLILWLVWWAWTQFTWTLNPADTNHPAVRLITLAATAAAFFMAQAIPDAFTSAGSWFAVAYVVVRVLGLGLQLGLASPNEDNAKAFVAWLRGSSVGLVAVIAGGMLPTPWREVLWTAALASDVLSAARAGRGRWHLHAAHFAERHGLIVIIALGESLIAAGVALEEDVPRDLTFAVATLTVVITVCALWWIYFGLAKDQLEDHLASQSEDQVGGEARNVYSWGHLPIIAGIIAFAVAIEQTLKHLDEPLGSAALVGLALGVVLYLSGIAYGLHRTGRSTMPWLVAAVAAVAGLLATQALLGLVSMLAVTTVLVAFAMWGSRSGRSTGATNAPRD